MVRDPSVGVGVGRSWQCLWYPTTGRISSFLFGKTIREVVEAPVVLKHRASGHDPLRRVRVRRTGKRGRDQRGGGFVRVVRPIRGWREGLRG